MSLLPKVVFIVGPTASGKTALGLTLAKEFNGEIVSADSRQFYKKMAIGTSQPEGEWVKRRGEDVFLVEGIPYHGIGIIDPGQQFSLADYKKMAFEKIAEIRERGRLPIVVGGTGLYIWGLIDNLDIPAVPPNKQLRQSLEEKPLDELVNLLRNVDPEAVPMIDTKNPRRVIRALEVAILSGQSFSEQRTKKPPVVEALQIGIHFQLPELYRRIDSVIDDHLAKGWVEETLALVKQRYSPDLPGMTSIGYPELTSYLADECTLEEATDAIKNATHHYAKRQITWFKRDKRIHWIESGEIKNARGMVQAFLLS